MQIRHINTHVNKMKLALLLLLAMPSFDSLCTQIRNLELDIYPISNEWELINTNTGIKRYSGEKPDGAKSPIIIDGQAYWLAGNGYTNGGSDARNDVISMNLATGDVSVVATLGKNHLKNNAVVEFQGKLLSITGSDNFITHNQNNVLAFDPITHEWRQHKAAPLARENAMAEYYDGKVFVFGGLGFDTYNRGIIKLGEDLEFYTEVNETATWRKEIQVYDISLKQWSVLESAPEAKVFRATALIQDKVYLSAEQDWVTASDKLDVYNVSSDTWSLLTLPDSLVNKKLVSVGPLLITYGQTDWAVSPNSHWKSFIYDTRIGKWYDGVPLPNPSESIEIFDFASDGNTLYYFEYASDAWDNTDKRTYSLNFDIYVEAKEAYVPFEQQEITEFQLQNGDKVQINSAGSVVNLTMTDEDDYDLIWKGSGTDTQKEALKRLTNSIYSQFRDSYEFMFLVFHETTPAPHPAPYGYHTPIQNKIDGIGWPKFNFTEHYGSASKLESVVVLGSKDDIIYGPSLHELGHRWGNYLEGSLHSLRQLGWTRCMSTVVLDHHWGLLSNGGQLGGWHEEDLAQGDNNDKTYLLNDGIEGTVGFRGIGPGNNSIGYSNLELYLMGLIPYNEVGELREPASPPFEHTTNPIFTIDGFHSIDMETVIQENGVRTPSVGDSKKSYNTLFVVVSKSPITQSDWNNYDLQVRNFTKPGHDDYLRLNNFWEATDGKASLYVPNAHEQILNDEETPQGLHTFGDYDGDGKADVGVRRPKTHTWYIKNSSDSEIQRINFGKHENDIPVSGDFDGDKIADIAVRRPSNQMWYIKNSSDGNIQRINFGKKIEDIPVPADYDGDGITDVAVRRPSNHMWYILNSSDGEIQRINFGKQAEDVPVPADYDGDGKADIAVRRPSNQIWYILNSSDGEIQRINFGKQADDIPIPADYDGDRKADIAVRRPSNQMWYILNSSNGEIQRINFGKRVDDIPIPADYDGDGKADLAVRRPSSHYQYILNSSDSQIQRIQFGRSANDIPLAAPITTRMNWASDSNALLPRPQKENTVIDLLTDHEFNVSVEVQKSNNF